MSDTDQSEPIGRVDVGGEPAELVRAFTELEAADAGVQESLRRLRSWKFPVALLVVGVLPLLILLLLSHR